MLNAQYDLVVIGAGPAGCATAIIAGRAGARVALLERGSYPRHKVCGEFVSPEALDLLASLLAEPHKPLLAEAPRISRSRIFLDGRILQTAISPQAASIARFDLDAALWESARASGVETRERTVVQRVEGAGPFDLVTSTGELEARAVINASGRWSNLRRSTEAAKPQEKWLGLKAHFLESKCEPSVDLFFFDGGYCGVQPVTLRHARENRVNVCAMVRSDIATSLPQVFSQHGELLERSRHWHQISDAVSTSPLNFATPRPLLQGMLLVGDAAGFVDPFVGDGISLALRSGAMAAGCLIPFFRSEKSIAEASHSYEQAYRKHLAPVFRASSRIRYTLRLPRRVRKPVLFALEKNPAVTQFLVSKTR